jgi:hypothetical protein
MIRRLIVNTLVTVVAATAVPVAAIAADHDHWGIRVFAAVYTAKDGYGGADIGRIIEDQCRHPGSCTVICNNETFGDAAPNHVKECRVAYSCGGDNNLHAAVADENGAINLDCRRQRYYQ